MNTHHRFIIGDVMAGLAALPDKSIHCVVTSPPYWGLRDYGVPGQIGLEPTPEEYVARLVEVFREVRRVLRKDGTLLLTPRDGVPQEWEPMSSAPPATALTTSLFLAWSSTPSGDLERCRRWPSSWDARRYTSTSTLATAIWLCGGASHGIRRGSTVRTPMRWSTSAIERRRRRDDARARRSTFGRRVGGQGVAEMRFGLK